MTYRMLAQDEWHRVAAIFIENGSAPPEIGMIAAAEEDGEIVGFVTLQIAWHCEPIWIREDKRAKVSCKMLVGEIDKVFQGEYYAFAPDERVEQIAQACGGETLPWKVLRKVVS